MDDVFHNGYNSGKIFNQYLKQIEVGKVKQIDISKEITYKEAILLPYKIVPWLTLLEWINTAIKLALAPLDVIATANFIDTSLKAVQASNETEWKTALLWLGCILFIKVFYYIEEPFSGLIEKKRKEKEWEAIDYPAIKLRASLKMQHIENMDSNDLISRTSFPSGTLCGIQRHFVDFLVFIGRIVSYLVILLINAPLAGEIILLTAVPMVLLARKSAMAQYKIKKDITKSERLAGSMKEYLQSRRCVSERNLFSYFKFINEKFRKAFMDSRKAVLQAEISWGVRKGVAGMALTVLCAVVIFLLMPSVTSGVLSVGLYISLIRTIFSAAEDIAYNLSPYLEQILSDRVFLKEYAQYIKLSRVSDALSPMSESTPTFESLVFEHVCFAYPGTKHEVLKDVSFRLDAGKRYSLIGVNGSGKSTIIKLILKFYDEYSGSILLNGTALAHWKLSDIKAMMSAVFQDFTHYDISLEDNISVGCGMCASEAQIDSAIDMAGLSFLVLQLSEGKKTPLGKNEENSKDLSGGEWQKIAIARTAISPSSLKIFDEPTAALDPIAERNVYERFDELSRGSTTIFISHRLASCLHADTIFLLDNGVIAECGTHKQLMEQNGKYREMFDSQRRWYL